MFTPDLILPSVFDITPKLLQSRGISALVLDVDNTLRTQGLEEPYPGVLDWVAEMKRAGVKLVISSNNFKRRVRPFARKLGLGFVAMSCKPFPIGLSRAVRQFGLPRRSVAIVGDQVFTDVVGGNLEGVQTILVSPYVLETNVFWRLRRALEKPVIRRYYRKKGQYPPARRDGASGVTSGEKEKKT